MKQVLALVEGSTEFNFIKEVLQPYLIARNVVITPTLTTTNRQKGIRGGIASYENIKYDIRDFLRKNHLNLVTTMFDFYALKRDFPGFDTLPAGIPQQRVRHISQAFQQDINDARFLAYLSLHEFEALLFSNVEVIAAVFEKNKQLELEKILEQYHSPEDINEGNPPSKRLLALYLDYEKTLHGPYISLEIGIDRIRQACAHFNEWLTTLEMLGKNDG